MSGKRCCDEEGVFSKTIQLLGEELKVEEMIIGFEESVWRAISNIMANVVTRGCSFHWVKLYGEKFKR